MQLALILQIRNPKIHFREPYPAREGSDLELLLRKKETKNQAGDIPALAKALLFNKGTTGHNPALTPVRRTGCSSTNASP